MTDSSTNSCSCSDSARLWFQVRTFHTCGRAAAPGSVQETRAELLSTQDVGVLAEVLDGPRPLGLVWGRRPVEAIQQLGWRGTPEPAGPACWRHTSCDWGSGNSRNWFQAWTSPGEQEGAGPLQVPLGRQVRCWTPVSLNGGWQL